MNLIKCAIILLMLNAPLEGSWWSDAWNAVKSTANTVGDGFKDAGNWVADRFRDTQTTRAVDFGVRLAALESAKGVAQGILEASQFVADTTLVGSYETASLGVKAAEEFLDKVVQNAAYGVLEASRQTANGVLEGAKQSAVGVLEGGRWVTNQALGTIDINCIHYDGSLQDLAAANLGNILVRGKLINPFEIRMTLDLKDPLSSAAEFAKSIGKMMVSAFLDPAKEKIEKQTQAPLDQAIAQVVQAGKEATTIENNLNALNTPQAVSDAQAKLKLAQDELEKKRQEIEMQADEARMYIKKSMALGFEDLLQFVAQQGTEITRETTLAKQELSRRIREKKKEILDTLAKETPTPSAISPTPAPGASKPA